MIEQEEEWNNQSVNYMFLTCFWLILFWFSMYTGASIYELQIDF